jgi:hypothetical protein
MGRASALVFARLGAPVAGCDLSAGAAQATVELVRGAGGEMVSKQLRHLTGPADFQALVGLALGRSAGSARCAASPRRRTSTGSRTSAARSGIAPPRRGRRLPAA